MIIIQLKGGLGNQLFQYAFGQTLAKEKNTSLKLDCSELVKYNKRLYRLDCFNISAQKATMTEILLHKYLIPHTYIEGYFQDENYFKKIENKIREEFSLKTGLIEKLSPIVHEITESNSVSVHIRRTDYLDKQHKFVIVPLDYYKTAMKTVSEKISKPKFFFFSDDIEWTRRNIPHPEDSIFLSNDDYQDLYLMSQCKHNIIANSTFSWWAAWLNKNQSKIVIAPKIWFTEEKISNKNHPLPKDWLQI